MLWSRHCSNMFKCRPLLLNIILGFLSALVAGCAGQSSVGSFAGMGLQFLRVLVHERESELKEGSPWKKMVLRSNGVIVGLSSLDEKARNAIQARDPDFVNKQIETLIVISSKRGEPATFWYGTDVGSTFWLIRFDERFAIKKIVTGIYSDVVPPQ